MPVCETLNRGIPFTKLRKLWANFPVEDNGKCSGFLDNLIAYVFDINKNSERIIAAPCVVIHAMVHSKKGDTYF